MIIDLGDWASQVRAFPIDPDESIDALETNPDIEAIEGLYGDPVPEGTWEPIDATGPEDPEV